MSETPEGSLAYFNGVLTSDNLPKLYIVFLEETGKAPLGETGGNLKIGGNWWKP